MAWYTCQCTQSISAGQLSHLPAVLRPETEHAADLQNCNKKGLFVQVGILCFNCFISLHPAFSSTVSGPFGLIAPCCCSPA